MSELEEAIKSRYSADSGITSAGSKGLWPLKMPQNPTLPLTVYQRISSPELELEYYTEPRFQFSCWATTYSGAVSLAAAVRECFYNKHLTVLGVHFRSSVLNLFDTERDPETGYFCRIVDMRFFLRET